MRDVLEVLDPGGRRADRGISKEVSTSNSASKEMETEVSEMRETIWSTPCGRHPKADRRESVLLLQARRRSA
jgi:hypothetical protein